MSQPEWNDNYQRYFYKLWDEQQQRYYWSHHVEGQGWVFFDYVPTSHPRIDHVYVPGTSGYVGPQPAGAAPVDRRLGHYVEGTYNQNNPLPYEKLDPAFEVKHGSYFTEGRMFAILFTEPAGTNALNINRINRVTRYNDNLSLVQYGEWAHTQVRRFIIVKRKREHCYAVPVFTYGNQGTLKHGVVTDEHAIAYSYGYHPQMLVGEKEFTKSPIAIVTNEGEPVLSGPSRIYFGIHHPIQYNVKVKDLGSVHSDWLPAFLGYWAMENGIDTRQSADVTHEAANSGDS